MEPPLQHIGSSKVQGYKALMHDLIIEAILHHHVTFDTLKSYLSDFNVEIYHDLCEKAITYYDMFATKNIKSSGHWTCSGQTIRCQYTVKPFKVVKENV